MNKAKYKVGQTVRVQVLDLVTTGTIIQRTLMETASEYAIRYKVVWNGKQDEYVEPWESSLDRLN